MCKWQPDTLIGIPSCILEGSSHQVWDGMSLSRWRHGSKHSSGLTKRTNPIRIHMWLRKRTLLSTIFNNINPEQEPIVCFCQSLCYHPRSFVNQGWDFKHQKNACTALRWHSMPSSLRIFHRNASNPVRKSKDCSTALEISHLMRELQIVAKVQIVVNRNNAFGV